MCSYGLVLLGVIPMVLAWRARALRALVVASVGGATVLLGFAAAGFWWFDGLAATRVRYFDGIAARRPYLLFLLVDLASFAVLVGPATAAGLARLRDRRLTWLVGAALVAVALADFSGMSKGEVERIWLPFAIWVLPAGAAVALRRTGGVAVTRVSGWLAAQVACAIVVQSVVRTPW